MKQAKFSIYQFYFFFLEETKLKRLDSLDHEIKTRESILITLKADIKSRQKLLEALQEIVSYFVKKHKKTFIIEKSK